MTYAIPNRVKEKNRKGKYCFYHFEYSLKFQQTWPNKLTVGFNRLKGLLYHIFEGLFWPDLGVNINLFFCFSLDFILML
jgi:hypothetical protein